MELTIAITLIVAVAVITGLAQRRKRRPQFDPNDWRQTVYNPREFRRSRH